MKKLTVGIISFNRGHYLRSLLHSFECFKDESSVEFVVVDMGSFEDEAMNALDVGEKELNAKIIRQAPSYDHLKQTLVAKNTLIRHATNSETLLLLHDECQYVGPNAAFLLKNVDTLLKSSFVCMNLSAVRRSTLASMNCALVSVNGTKCWRSLSDDRLCTTGLFRSEMFLALGPYFTDLPPNAQPGDSENVMNVKAVEHYGKNLSLIPHVPAFVPVWNDPRGGHAFINGSTRVGNYLPPIERTYYRQLTNDEIESMEKIDFPHDFIDVAHPIGWTYAKDSSGDQLKCSRDTMLLEGPKVEVV